MKELVSSVLSTLPDVTSAQQQAGVLGVALDQCRNLQEQLEKELQLACETDRVENAGTQLGLLAHEALLDGTEDSRPPRELRALFFGVVEEAKFLTYADYACGPSAFKPGYLNEPIQQRLREFTAGLARRGIDPRMIFIRYHGSSATVFDTLIENPPSPTEKYRPAYTPPVRVAGESPWR